LLHHADHHLSLLIIVYSGTVLDRCRINRRQVAGYRDALKGRTGERVPLDWARTQNNLGSALCRLGELESGTERLEEAVAAYREALKEYTAAAAPYYHPRTLGSLARAEALLAARRNSHPQT